MGSNEIVGLIKDHLEKQADPERAISMKSYMKNKFELYGISSPERSKILGSVWSIHKKDIQDNFRDIVEILWDEEKRECQYFAMDILKKCQSKLNIEDIEFIRHKIISKSWWDTVDFLASNSVGHILKGKEELIKTTIKDFLTSKNMWLARTTLLFQLKYRDKVDEKLLYRCILYLIGSKEFFINKAIGWSLRQYSKTNPESVSAFIEYNKEILAPLSIREGSKYL